MTACSVLVGYVKSGEESVLKEARSFFSSETRLVSDLRIDLYFFSSVTSGH